METDDVRTLRAMGYQQELARRMSGFSNYAISFSIICILAGGITSLQLGTSAAGGAAAGIAWPIGVGLCFIVSLCMAQIASAFPTAGGLYHWASILGGRGWGWAAAWFNLAGLIFVTASVNVGAYGLITGFLGPIFGFDPGKLTALDQLIGVSAITGVQALLNHVGIRAVTRLTDFSGYLICIVAGVLTGSFLFFARHLDPARLFTFANVTGDAGGGVWPARPGMLPALLLALMWPIYTITGQDASAHTAEETLHAARNVPAGILRSVAVSGILGWVMVSSFVLAMPDVGTGAHQGSNVFAWLMQEVLPGSFGKLLWAGVVLANLLCGLACVTSVSRMIYAFARDGGLPASAWLRRISPTRRTPAVAVWVAAVLAIASTVYSPAYSTLTAACVMFLYISYVMPTVAGCFKIGSRWTKMGPFNLGKRWFRCLAVVAVLFVALLIWIGVQPPNEQARYPLIGLAVLLPVAWWSGVRKRFKGPPNCDEQGASL